MTDAPVTTSDQVRALLAVSMAYDNRTVDEADVAAWLKAAELGHWTFAAARDAIHWHHTNDPAWLKPAHITRYIRANRSQPQHIQNQRQIQRGTPAGPTSFRHVIAELGKALGWRSGGQSRNHPALAVPCPWPACHAAPGRPCAVPITRGPRAGQSVPMPAPHEARVKAADEARQETSA